MRRARNSVATAAAGGIDRLARGVRARGRRQVVACALLASCALASTAAAASAAPLTFKREAYEIHDDARSGSKAVAAGDFDGDGRDDVAVAVSGIPGVAVLLSKPGDTFSRTSYAMPSVAEALVTGDFNGDGRSDLAAAQRTSGVVSVWLAQPGGGLGSRADYATGDGPNSIAVADFNRDATLDLAVANMWGDSISLLFGQRDGTFGARTDHPFSPEAYTFSTAIAAGDFDRDGFPDLALTGRNPDALWVLRAKPGGGFDAPVRHTVEANPVAVTAADFNGDGDLDLAVANEWSNSISVLLGQSGAGFGARRDHRTGEMPSSVSVGDLNRDGDPDLVIANSYWDEVVSVMLGDTSGGGFQPRTDHAVGSRLVEATVGDFNGDSVPDFAAGHDYWRVSVFTNATWLPELSVSPSALNFPRAAVQGTSRRSHYGTMTVSNTGAGSLHVTSTALEGPHQADFRVVSDTCSGRALAVGATCNVTVRFMPVSQGHRRATLRFDSNAWRAPHRVSLTGAACLSYITYTFFGSTTSTWVGCP